MLVLSSDEPAGTSGVLDDDEKTRAVELLRRVEEFVSPCAAARRGH